MKSKIQRVTNNRISNQIYKSSFVNRKSSLWVVMVRPEGIEPSTH